MTKNGVHLYFGLVGFGDFGGFGVGAGFAFPPGGFLGVGGVWVIIVRHHSKVGTTRDWLILMGIFR